MSENDSTPPERVDKTDLSRHDFGTGADAQEQASIDSAERMDISPTPALQNGLQSSLHTSAVPSDAGTPTVDTSDINGAAPYGTRSRNRTGASRPNYAEDKELDHLIEANGKITKSAPPKAAATPAAVDFEPADNERHSNNQARRGFAAVNANVSDLNGNTPVARDLIPGTSTFSANPSVNGTGPAPQSKKRKQPGGNTTISAPHVANNLISRIPRSSAGARQHQETNMMTFEGCGARLTANKELKADDGTILAVNGTYPESSLPRQSIFLSRPCLLTYCSRPRLLHLRATRRAILPCSNHGVSSHKW
jgi:hypothetical protein